ncbi:MAG TPA: serine protease [Oligoflexia bacterium]|nr:serine protease [Oligoflexia bacterium]
MNIVRLFGGAGFLINLLVNTGWADQRGTLATVVKRRWGDAVVRIVVKSKSKKELAYGSGFFISNNGVLVTNFHVIEPFVKVKTSRLEFELFDGRIVRDFEVGNCEKRVLTDLCILRLAVEPEKHFTLDSREPIKGESVFNIGNPGKSKFRVGSGKYLGLYKVRNGGIGYISFTNPIRPGDSGGPIFTIEGQLVGVATLRISFGNNKTTKHFVGVGAHEVARLRKTFSRFEPWQKHFARLGLR